MLRRLACLILFVSLCSTQASAQSRVDYERYADLIKSKGDSAIVIISAANQSAGSADSIGSILSTAGGRISRIAGDFDARTPPADMQRVHAQIVEALDSAGEAFAQAGRYLSMDCEPIRVSGVTCGPREKLAASREAESLLAKGIRQMNEYVLARRRAGDLLKEHGVTLPES